METTMTRLTFTALVAGLTLSSLGAAHAERTEPPVKTVAVATGAPAQGFVETNAGYSRKLQASAIYEPGSRK
jgi:hypothetical protein